MRRFISRFALVIRTEFLCRPDHVLQLDSFQIAEEWVKAVTLSRLSFSTRGFRTCTDHFSHDFSNLLTIYFYTARHTPQFHHDEVTRDRKINWDPEHAKEIENLPFLQRVWARTKHPEQCTKCNGLEKYKLALDEKMVQKIRNITAVEQQLRHGKSK